MTSYAIFFRMFDVNVVYQRVTDLLEVVRMEFRGFKILPKGQLSSWNVNLNFNEFSNCKRIKHCNSKISFELVEFFYGHLKGEENQ